MGKNEFDIEKLRGSENYHTWKFAMENYLEMNQLDKCIKASDGTDNPIEEKPEKLSQAKARLVLSVDTSLYVHIQKCTSPLEIWKKFQVLYEDKGWLRKIGLLRTLMSIRLENSENMQSYVEQIMEISNKLNGIGFPITEDWLGAIMLAGLTDDYKPLIMSFEGSNTEINSDVIKTKLLDSQFVKESNNDIALLSKGKPSKENYKKKYKNIRCYNCGKKNHLSSECRQKSSAQSLNTANKGQSKNSKCALSAFMQKKAKDKPSDWYLDSGATNHMTPNENLLCEQSSSTVSEITTANNQKMEVKSMGKVHMKIENTEVEIKNVLYVPELSTNILSIREIVQKGNKVTFNKKGCSIFDQYGGKIIQCKSDQGLYKVNGDVSQCLLSKENQSIETWHRRLGHINYQDLCKMRNGVVNGINFRKSESIPIKKCEICLAAKQPRLPFKLSETRSENILDLVHSDLCGPMEKPSIGGARYLLTFIDDYSRKVFVHYLKSKSEVLPTFIDFKVWIEKQTGRNIKIFRTDNGTEYTSKNFVKFCKVNGIQHQLTNVYTPQQNGVAERMNRTLIERAKCMLFDADLNKSFWAEATNMAAYIINRSICSALVDKTPEEVWSKEKVNVSNLRIFGCPVSVHIPKEKRKKLDSKSLKLIFVGYDSNKKGFRCIDPITNKLTISRDVIFLEDTDETNSSFRQNSEEVREILNEDLKKRNELVEKIDTSTDSISTTESENTIDSKPYINAPDFYKNSQNEDELNEIQLRRSSRIKYTPTYLKDHVTYLSRESTNFDPSSFEEILNRKDAEKWKLAMNEEMNSLSENNTWTLEKLPQGKKALKSKWVFKTKRDEEGNIIRYKARLVAKGCSQKYGVDYNETFSPVARYSSIRFLVALAVKNNLKIDQMDAVTAFLQGDLDEEIFLEQPEGFDDGTDFVCKLNKSMYGLKQSGRQWNLKLDAALKSFGLHKSKMDPCVYYSKSSKLILAVYVDDILIFWQDLAILNKLKESLKSCFKMKDMGTAKNCIGIRITQTDEGIELDQTAYANEILHRFGMEECKPISTPSEVGQKLSTKMVSPDHTNKAEHIPYQEAVGSLLYLAQGTRPDIAFAVNDVSRFNSNHSEVHWKAVKRILRYLKGTIDFKLKYLKNGKCDLVGYTDADWASDVDKRRSCTGFLFKMAKGAVTWSSKRQPTVALSTTEAEYMALSSAVQEAIWLKQLGNELDNNFDNPIELLCDNQSAIKLTESEGFRPRTKHIDIRHHYLREKVEDGTVIIKYITSEEMAADNLTKAVTREKHNYCVKQMGLC